MPFDFNIYSSLLLPAFIQAILFSGLLFYRGWKEEKLNDKLLGLLLLLNSFKIAFWMLGFAGWYETHDGYTSFMFYFPFNNIIWMGPLLYFYFLSLSNTAFKLERKHLKHFILPLCWWAMIIFKLVADHSFYYPFPDSADSQYGTKGPWAELDKLDWLVVLSYLIFFYYLLLTIRSYKKYRDYVRENFSATDEIRFDWLRNILYAISAGVIIGFIFTLIALLRENGSAYIFDWYGYLFLGLITYYISIAGYFIKPSSLQKLHFAAETQPEIPGDTRPKPVEPIPELDNWKEKLVRYMEQHKPYLEPELNLSDLAKQLVTNTSVLSKVINDGTGRNFNDFINHYRVAEVIEKLKSKDHEKMTLLGIAYDCGFNSKATFNRAFKKMAGTTPKEFISNLPVSG
ncbi:MAG: helix-turn-helix transcriptional regulator [Chitinophagaceae bacterium]|nr:helix-turn-helix transcriptional regulator [Chitinophagaceae bacterium]